MVSKPNVRRVGPLIWNVKHALFLGKGQGWKWIQVRDQRLKLKNHILMLTTARSYYIYIYSIIHRFENETMWRSAGIWKYTCIPNQSSSGTAVLKLSRQRRTREMVRFRAGAPTRNNIVFLIFSSQLNDNVEEITHSILSRCETVGIVSRSS